MRGKEEREIGGMIQHELEIGVSKMSENIKRIRGGRERSESGTNKWMWIGEAGKGNGVMERFDDNEVQWRWKVERTQWEGKGMKEDGRHEEI